MTWYPCNNQDQTLMAQPTYKTASGSVATFETDMTENLISCIAEIVAQQASGTPSPTNPIPITTYTSLNLSHSGADTSNPNITNIPFGQTVAKGTLNVTTGVLEITHGVAAFNGNTPISELGLTMATGYTQISWIPYISLGKGTEAFLCDTLEFVSINNQGLYKIWNNMHLVTPTPRMFLGLPDTITTREDAIAWFANNPTTVVFELATPITVQLSATQIRALLNQNNIWCDTNGDTEVKYILSVGEALRQA